MGEAGPSEDAVSPKQTSAIFFETTTINIEWTVTKRFSNMYLKWIWVAIQYR
jgi:hypothetical protein